MRLNIIAGGLITEVYDDHDKKVGSVSMSKQERTAINHIPMVSNSTHHLTRHYLHY